MTDSFMKPYEDAGHDIKSLFEPGQYKCSRCGAHQINLSVDLVYSNMRKCKDIEDA